MVDTEGGGLPPGRARGERMIAKGLSLISASVLLAALLLPGVEGRQRRPSDLRQPQELLGLSVPSQVATIAPEQSGKIVAIPVGDGDPVAQGQVLFRLSSKLQELEVERLRALAESDLIELRARTGFEHAKKQEARVRQLRAKEISSDSDLQERVYELELSRLRLNQAVMEQAQAANELEQAVERLAQRTLASPFAGLVAQRFKSVGETVEMFVAVLEIVDLDPLWVEFDCPVADERFFAIGTEVSLAPAVRPEDVRTGTVVYTSIKASPSSHTFVVRAAVANPANDWKSGLKMLVRRLPSSGDAPSLPGK